MHIEYLLHRYRSLLFCMHDRSTQSTAQNFRRIAPARLRTWLQLRVLSIISLHACSLYNIFLQMKAAEGLL